MGWTSYNATYYKNGKVDCKAECDNYFNHDDGYEVLKSQMVGSVYYAAVKKVGKHYSTGQDNYKKVDLPIDKQYVFAAVFLTSIDNNDYYNFSYKAMDESEGSCETRCPVSILKLLMPKDSELANEWRKCWWQNIEMQKKKRKDPHALTNLSYGSVISFEINNKNYLAVKRVPAYQFKRAWWQNTETNNYIPLKYIPEHFKVVSIGTENI